MPRTNKILIRSGTVAPTASDFAVGEPAFDKSAGKFYVKNAAGTMVEIGAGGSGATEVYEYATTADFPATGSAAVLYLATDSSRIYRWAGSTNKYVELGTLSANTPAASLQSLGSSGTAKTLAPTDLYGGVCSLTLTGNCTVTMPALASGQQFTLLLVQDSTGGRTATFTDVRWPSNSAPTFTTTKGGTDIIRFVCDGTYWLGTVSQAHATYAAISVEYLVVAGGGAGGYDYGGGGGGGGVRYGTLSPSPGAVTVTVGSGGTASTSNQSGNGGNSVFSTITATGGGGGGRGAATNAGADGGSGGGAGGRTSAGTNNGGAASPATSPVQGYAGGTGTYVNSSNNDFPSGGGGGATGVGSNGVGGQCGNGGPGYTSSITGTSTVYGAGGGAGGYGGAASRPTLAGAAGGTGAGAGGYPTTTAGGAGTANTGGGGGGGSGGPGNGGNGGSGIVVLKFQDTFTPTVGSGLTYTSTTSGGYRIYTFTAGTGTVTF